jgi:ankyrin repeat protein
MMGNFNMTAAQKPAPGELVAAADIGDVDAALAAIKDLLQRDAAIDEKNADGETALQIAISRGCAEMACLLLDSGANPDIKDPDGDTPLIRTAYYGHQEWARQVAQKLLEKGALLGEKNNAGDTVFAAARFTARSYGRSGVEFLEMLKAAAAARKAAAAAVAAEKARREMVERKLDFLRAHAPHAKIKPAL